MTREEFNDVIARFARMETEHPRAFKWRVAGLAGLGISYLLAVLVLSLGCTLGLVILMIRFPNAATIKLGIIFGIACGGLSWAILRGLFVRMPRPEGRRLARKEVPALFRAVDELRSELGAPAFHEILLTPDHNAGVVQTPRLGVFGWYRNSLLLGLPLMQGVSAEEFRAILAHEFAHLSGSHGKFGAWIYRLRRVWERVFEELTRQKRRSIVLGKFLNWFWPRFNAKAFVLSRAQEYQADATAAELTSAAALGHGLIRTQVQGRWLDERFWPDFFRRAREIAAPPATLFREIAAGLSALHAHPDAARWMTQAFNFETNSADTHPALRDRLAALMRVDPTFNASVPLEDLEPDADAASVLLGDQRELLANELSEHWAELVRSGWKQRHEETVRLSEELARREGEAPGGVDSLWARAKIVIDRDGDEKARPLIEEILSREPHHPGANFVVGRCLLEQDDAAGVERVENAMGADRTLTGPGCELLDAYFARTGQPDRIRALEQRFDRYSEEMQLADVERADATVKDAFTAPELTGEETSLLHEVLAKYPEIAEVHIVRKQVRHLPDVPMYVIALKLRNPWWKFRLSSSNEKLVNSVAEGLKLRGNWLVFVDESNLRKLAKKLRTVPGSAIYTRRSTH